MEKLIQDYQLKRRVYKKGEILFRADTHPFGFFWLTAGTVKVYSSDKNGREIILRLASKGDFIGHSFLLGEKFHHNSAKAIEVTECIFIDAHDFQRLMLNNPEMNYLIMKELNKELQLAQNRCVDLIKKNVRERLASYFYYMAHHHSISDEKGIKIRVQLSREEIASIIGTANETTIRFISEFKEMGLIEEADRFFHILDLEKLASLGKVI
jgi:CRP-like cAMP-binding protein